ncbi:MAG TPA: LysR family transcriptional regulator substrate-binding protein, partial [Pyrinomonadaceae bacterium]|nr:LysR family transcriptional regulator substrate-binding protein [Pyrinomonadaceae bacterium]
RIPKEIASREVELGVLSFKPADAGLKAMQVLTDELVLIVAPGHRLAAAENISIKELADETFIAHNAKSPYREKVIECFANNRTPLRITVELPSLEAIKRMVEQNAGVALVPRLTAAAEIESGRLRGVTVKEMRLERRLHIVYRRNSPLSHAAKAFLELAGEMAARAKPAVDGNAA